MSTEPFFVPPWADQQLVGIRGWLILPLLGLIITIIFLGFSAVSGFIAETNQVEVTPNVSIAENYPGSAQIVAMVMLVAQVFISFFTLGLAVYCLILFLKKKQKTPFWMIVFYLCGLVLALLNAANMTLFPDLYEEFLQQPANKMDAFRTVAQTIMQTAIWVGYFRTSKRVAATFIN